MDVVTALITWVLLLLSWWYTWHVNREKNLRSPQKYIPIAMILIGTIAVGGNWYNQKKSAKEQENRILAIQNTSDSLLAQNGLVLGQMIVEARNRNSLLKVTDSLRKLMNAFYTENRRLLTVRESGVRSTSLQQIASTTLDTVSTPRGVLRRLTLRYRASTPSPLRDIHVGITLNVPIDTADAQIHGAVVFERGSRTIVSRDQRTLDYYTDYLGESNDLFITLLSRSNPIVLQQELEPK